MFDGVKVASVTTQNKDGKTRRRNSRSGISTGKTAKVKYRKLRKKTRTVAASKVLTVKAPGQSAIYIKLSGKKKITINKYTGKVTVKKKLKRAEWTKRLDRILKKYLSKDAPEDWTKAMS